MSDKVNNKRGRKPWVPDLVEVERVAGLGLSEEQIAVGLGIGKSSYFKKKADSEEFLEAVKRGRFTKQQAILEQLEAHSKKNVLATIMLARNVVGWNDKDSQQAAPAVNVRVEIMSADQAQVKLVGGHSEADRAATEPLAVDYEEVE